MELLLDFLDQSNEVSQDEKMFLNFLRNQIAFPEGKEEELIYEIFKGGYVILEDDGKTYAEWSKLKSCRERLSSHASDAKQYGIQGPIVKEWLFSRKQLPDERGNPKVVTWFQLERYPTQWVYSIAHLWTYVLYKWTGENQGPYGSSKYQESFPLLLNIKSS